MVRKMLNIICNANPTIEVTVTIIRALVESKSISLNQAEAEELFVNMQTKPTSEWDKLECVSNVISKLETDLLDENNDYEVEIKFDDKYIEYMNQKYPSKDYSDYYEKYEIL